MSKPKKSDDANQGYEQLNYCQRVFSIAALQRLLRIEADSADRSFVALGLLTQAQMPRHMRCDSRKLLERWRLAARLGQLQVYFDHFGRYCGHILWTCVASEVRNEILEAGPDEWDLERFSCKGDTWILEFSALYGTVKNIMCAWVRDLPQDCVSISYFRVKGEKTRIAKQVARADISSSQSHSSVKSIPTEPFILSADGAEFRHAVEQKWNVSLDLGRIMVLLCNVPEYASAPLAMIYSRVRHAIRKKQYRLYVSDTGEPVGFFSWAWLDASERECSCCPEVHTLSPEEWDEGRELVLCDAVAEGVGFALVMEDLRRRWQPGESFCVYPRVGEARGLWWRFAWMGGKRLLPGIEMPSASPDLVRLLVDGLQCRS